MNLLEALPKILSESQKQVEKLLNAKIKPKAQLNEIIYPNAKMAGLFTSLMSDSDASDSERQRATASDSERQRKPCGFTTRLSYAQLSLSRRQSPYYSHTA